MPYSEITTLTTNNSISEMMSKVNEIVYELNDYAPSTSNTLSNHIANNYAHGVVIENILFNANTGVLDINYNDLSTANINLQLGTEDDVYFKTVTANTFYARDIQVTGNVSITEQLNVASNTNLLSFLNVTSDIKAFGNVDITKELNVTGNTFFFSDVYAQANVSVSDTASFNNIVVSGTVELDTDLHVTGSATIDLNLEVNGGNFTTTANTFNLLSSPTVLNVGAGSAEVHLGSFTGSTYTRHDLRVTGDVFITGQELNTTTPIFNLLNTTANTINFGGDAEEINIGSQTGTVAVRHNETIAGTLGVTGNTAMTGALLVNSGIVNSNSNTVNLFATPLAITLGSSGTTIDIGSTSGITSIRNNTEALGTLDVTGVSTFTSNVSINSGILTTTLGTFNILPDTGNINIGASNTGITIIRNNTQIDGTFQVKKDVTLDGSLIVKGDTTTIDTNSILIKDKNIEIGVVAVPTNTTADGGGITLKGAVGGDKTITWDLPNNNWTSSENWNLSSGKTYKINNVEVLSANGISSSITESFLTSVGTITTGVWNGSTIDIAYGGTNITSYTKGDVLYASANNVLTKLPIGSVDQLFQVTSDGLVHWVGVLDAGDY